MFNTPQVSPFLPKLISSLLRIEDEVPKQIKQELIKLTPNVMKPCLNLMPFSIQKKLDLSALHSIFKEAISDGDFVFLQNKWLKISIVDLQITWWLSIEGNQFIMASKTDNISEDVSFTSKGNDLILIAGRKEDPDTLFFQRRLMIEGNTELGLELKNVIDSIDLAQLPNSIHTLIDLLAFLLYKNKNSTVNK